MKNFIKTTDLFGMPYPGTFEVKRGACFNELTNIEVFVSLETDYNAYIDFVESRPHTNRSDSNTKEFVSHIVSDDGVSFKGGTYKDLINPKVDISRVEKATKELEQSKVWNKVSTAFSEKMTRRRIRCEYDGDYDFDKRWDAEPFQTRQKRPQMIRSLNLSVEGGFSAYVSQDTINQFGAFVVALINLLEKNGVQVGVAYYQTGQRFLENIEKSLFRSKMHIKKPDEYLPIGQLTKALSSNFYRRAGFSMIVACAEVSGNQVSDSLGRPYPHKKTWELSGNNLSIYSVPSIDEQNKIVESLLKVVNELEVQNV